MWYGNDNEISLWARDVTRAIDNADGPALAFLLRAKFYKFSDVKLCGLDDKIIDSICRAYFGKYNNTFGPGMCQFLTEYLKVFIMLSNSYGSWDDVVRKSFKLLDLWMDIYLNTNLSDHHWLVPALHSMCNFISKIGILADRAHSADDSLHETEDEDKDKYMKQVLSNVRSKMGRVRGDDSRHSAYIVLLGQSIKGCMQLRNMQMAAGFLKAIESTSINYSRALRGPLINYRYYLGKLHMQKEEYLEAEEHLSWAFSNCLKDSFKMRKHILECLIVVRVGLGKLPPDSLLEKYRLMHYHEIISAIKVGNVKRFVEAMDTFADIFIKEGTILCVEQLKYIAYRTLIKNTKNWWSTNVPSTKSNMISIDVLVCAVKWQLGEITQNEILCICANLIKRGYLRGYISWERLMIVFSNLKPFPPIGKYVT